MNKIIASSFSVLFAILAIVIFVFLIYSSFRFNPYIFLVGFFLFIIVFGFLAVLLDIRDEIILIRERLFNKVTPKFDKDGRITNIKDLSD